MGRASPLEGVMRRLRDLWRRFYFEVAWNGALDKPGVYGTCDVCWEREWLPLKRAQDDAEVKRLLHGICDALDPSKPTEPILRALLHGTEHEGHR